MSLRRGGVLLGCQTPRVRLEPRAVRNDADDAAFLAARYGLVPDEWQKLVLRSWLSVRSDGQWAARRCGLSVPRQNGKNGILEMRELFGMVVLGEKFLHTAHEVKTARKAFLRLQSFFENPRDFPELAALVVDIRKTNGQEAVILRNGGSCEFVARSKGSARGFTVDVLVMDEAQELGDDAIEALLPTISAAPLGNPQQIFTGTPPGPKANGEIFTRVRQDGLAGKDKALAWDEWSCEPSADLDAPTSLAQSNPGLGIRINRDVTEAERGTLSDEGFGRERLGMWDEASTQRVIPQGAWSAIADVASKPDSLFTLAVDVAPDRTVAAVALAGLRADGRWHVELDQQRNGVAWVAPWIQRRCQENRIRAVVVDGSSPAMTVVEDLARLKVRTTVMTARDVAQAFGVFYDGVAAETLRHNDQPQVAAALTVARKRELAGGSAWSRKTSTSDITPIVACTFALWGSQRVKQPTRPGRGGRGDGRAFGRERRTSSNRVATVS